MHERCGLAGADDALLLQVARAAAATSNELPSVQHAALLHPPLSALVTVHCADWSDGTALMRWARGLWSTSPWRTLRLSATAVLSSATSPHSDACAGERDHATTSAWVRIARSIAPRKSSWTTSFFFI